MSNFITEDMLSPQPTMGKELVDFFFALSFWMGMIVTGVGVLVMWLLDAYSFELLGMIAGSAFFWSLAYGLLMVMVIGMLKKVSKRNDETELDSTNSY